MIVPLQLRYTAVPNPVDDDQNLIIKSRNKCRWGTELVIFPCLLCFWWSIFLFVCCIYCGFLSESSVDCISNFTKDTLTRISTLKPWIHAECCCDTKCEYLGFRVLCACVILKNWSTHNKSPMQWFSNVNVHLSSELIHTQEFDAVIQ